MSRKDNEPTDAAELHRRAEKRLKALTPDADSPRTDADTQRLLHELQVHQVELEMTNEELRQARDDLESRVNEQTAEVARRTAAEQKLREQSELLHKLGAEVTLAEQRERQRLASMLHDEHQQFLVGAKLRASLLERAKDQAVREAGREIIALLEEALDHTRSLIRELNPPILTTGGLIPAFFWLARWMEEKHHLTVDLRPDETAVSGPQDLIILLFQAVRELLFNVVKHAKVSTARVEMLGGDGEVCILVADRGVGFDPASLRVEGGTAGSFGLFSIRQRLALLGGRLEIDSAPGQGSRIRLWAPLKRARTITLPAPVRLNRPEGADMTAEAPPARSRTGKIRVLVVDDHKVVRQGLVRLLTAEPDIEIVGEAANGTAAVALTCQLQPDVVTMDISMPGMNGIEATRVIHGKSPAVRVIGLSMFEDGEQARAMWDAGAVAFLGKSGAADALVAAIRDCVESRKKSGG